MRLGARRSPAIAGSWLARRRTDQNGRCAQLVAEGEKLAAGNYRLSFDTASLFCGAEESKGLYPLVQVQFAGARWRRAFSHSAAAESERLHDVPGKLSEWRWPKIDTANRASDWCA